MATTYKLISALPVLLILLSCGSSNDESVSGAGKNANACGTVVDLGLNSLVNARLEDGDCEYFSVFPDSGGGDISFVDEYRVTLATMGTLSITMRSSESNAYLFILNTTTTCAAGCSNTLIIIEDDNGAGGTDAMISMTLQPEAM
jgi:hypothetical protein